MIDSIWIKSFRCLAELSFSFSNGRFLSIISQNNVGKTSILEACYVLGHLSSFVSSDLSQIVPFNLDASYMGVKIIRPNKNFNYYLKVDQQGKKYINLNERPVRKKADIHSLFRSMYISSDSLLLITSRPSFRRQHLDLGISQLSLAYRKNLSTYKRLMLQKNRLLKDGGNQQMVYQINAQIAPLIRQIQRQRLMYLQDVEQRVQSFFESLNFIEGQVSIEYISHTLKYKDEEELLVAINQNLSKELIIKCTNFGPHRDDFNFLINGKNIRSYFSRGVCRILAYFFQLSQSFLLEEATGLPILLLLDEPFSEIHPSLKNKLIGCIPSLFYVIYTSTQTDEISCLNKDQIYAINNGTLCKI